MLPIPNDIRTKIDDRLLKLVVPHKKTFLNVQNLCARISMGGIGKIRKLKIAWSPPLKLIKHSVWVSTDTTFGSDPPRNLRENLHQR